MTSPLIDFLETQLAKDEEAARSAERNAANRWVDDDGFTVRVKIRTELGWSLGNSPVLAHMSRHSPTRVLREVEAKRRVLARHSADTPPYEQYCRECENTRLDQCPELRDLAAPFSNHPDYRKEWASPSIG